MELNDILVVVTGYSFGLGIWFNGISNLGDIYPTPPLGQDMTQGQFLSGV